MLMNFGMVVLNQDIDKVLKLPVPFVFRAYRNFLGTVKVLFKGMEREGSKIPETQNRKRDDKVQRILKKMEPPEEWFKKK